MSGFFPTESHVFYEVNSYWEQHRAISAAEKLKTFQYIPADIIPWKRVALRLTLCGGLSSAGVNGKDLVCELIECKALFKN